MITILGPTASGKTTLAVALAQKIDGEILSADSRQVYRRMTIGTGKDLGEYGSVPYHLIDIAEPGERYNVYRFQQDFHAALNDIIERGKTPILCGGTGLYIEAVLKDYAFNAENGVQNANLKNSVIFGNTIDRELRREKITARLYARLEEGLVEEVQSLINEGVSIERLLRYGLEYKFVTEYCIGQRSYESMVHDLEIAIHQFAKRQMTWFRGMERRALPIHWLQEGTIEQKVNEMLSVINGLN